MLAPVVIVVLNINSQRGVNPAFGPYRFYDIGSFDRMSFTRYISPELGVDGSIDTSKGDYWRKILTRSLAKIRSNKGKDIIALKAWLDSSRVLSKLGEVPTTYSEIFPSEMKVSESEFLAYEPYRVFVKVVLSEWVREKLFSMEAFKKIDPTGEATYELRTKFPTDRTYMTYRRSVWDNGGEAEFVGNRTWAKNLDGRTATEGEVALAIQNLRVGEDFGHGMHQPNPDRVKSLLEIGLTRFPKSGALQYLLAAYFVNKGEVNASQISTYLEKGDDYQWRKLRVDRARKGLRE